MNVDNPLSRLLRTCLFCLVISLFVAGCSSNEPEPEEEIVPIGTFKAQIDGVEWEAEVARGLSRFVGVEPVSGDSVHLLVISGLSLGESPTTSMGITVLNPEETRYTGLPAEMSTILLEGDVPLFFRSSELEFEITELTEEIARGWFNATLTEETMNQSMEITDGLFAVDIGTYSDTLGFIFPFPILSTVK